MGSSMRRALGSFVLAAVLLLAVAAAPLGAAAGPKPKTPTLPTKLPLSPAPSAPAESTDPAPAPARSGGGGGGASGDWAAVAGLGALAVGMLALGLLAAKRARLRKVAKPPRKTQEAGRLRARGARPQSTEAALLALHDARLGQVLESQPVTGGMRIMVDRPRGHPCAEVSGYLAGLFESAWAMDVRVDHWECAGKQGPCRYVITRSDAPRIVARVSSSGRREEAASIPGWSAAARQSPRARGGAG